MKINIKNFVRNEDGNNLVIALIILGVVALPLIFWLTGLANTSRDRASDSADEIFNEDTGSQYGSDLQYDDIYAAPHEIFPYSL